jgi:hypothetical protein
MSFRCQNCDRVAIRGTMVTTETREKVYSENRGTPERPRVEVVGAGFETVTEERWCLPCVTKYEALRENPPAAEA